MVAASGYVSARPPIALPWNGSRSGRRTAKRRRPINAALTARSSQKTAGRRPTLAGYAACEPPVCPVRSREGQLSSLRRLVPPPGERLRYAVLLLALFSAYVAAAKL